MLLSLLKRSQRGQVRAGLESFSSPMTQPISCPNVYSTTFTNSEARCMDRASRLYEVGDFSVVHTVNDLCPVVVDNPALDLHGWGELTVVLVQLARENAELTDVLDTCEALVDGLDVS